jgi:hypothetical protein
MASASCCMQSLQLMHRLRFVFDLVQRKQFSVQSATLFLHFRSRISCSIPIPIMNFAQVSMLPLVSCFKSMTICLVYHGNLRIVTNFLLIHLSIKNLNFFCIILYQNTCTIRESKSTKITNKNRILLLI